MGSKEKLTSVGRGAGYVEGRREWDGEAVPRPLFVMIRRVTRGLLLLLCLPYVCAGESLEDAVRALVKKVSARMAANEVAHVTPRNLSSMGSADAAKAQTLFDRGLRKRLRNPVTVEMSFTISENLRGFLFVAEMKRDAERAVEMVEYRPDASKPATAVGIAIEKKQMWEQEAPILDVSVQGTAMLVLDTVGLARYERKAGAWEQVKIAPIAFPPVRDPRGRLEVVGESVTVYLPGGTCRQGSASLELLCVSATESFTVDGREVHFVAGRNSVEGAANGFGESFAVCGGVLSAGAGGRDAEDSVAVFAVGNGRRAISEAVQFSGPVTALWPAPGGAVVVARHLVTGRYAAYSLTIDCGR